VIIFFCPAVLDTLLSLVLFVVSYGAGERGLTMAQCAWLGGVYMLAYTVASPVSGFLLSRRNARAMLIASTALSVVLAVMGVALKAFIPLLAVLAGFGVTTACFFNSFQTFMRGESPPGGLARTTALYTLAWSLGSSAGFLLSGTLYRLGPVMLSLLAAVIGGLVLAILIRHESRPHHALSADDHVEPAHDGAAVDHATYVWVAWIIIFTAMFVQRPIGTFYPALSARHGVAPAVAGAALFLHMLTQGITGGVMTRASRLLYRRSVLVAVQWAAALLFGVMWLVPSPTLAFIGISVLGVWAGFAYFWAVYYSSNSGHRSRNVGVNECLVGLGSFAGLFASEWAMKHWGGESVLYAVCALALFGSGALQWLVAGGRRQ
jgi:hypothetical protein